MAAGDMILGNLLSLSDYKAQWANFPQVQGANQMYMFSINETLEGDEKEPLRIDEISDTLVYLGYIRPVYDQTKKANAFIADTTRPIWKIVKMEQTGTVWERTYADGDKLYDNIWDDRLGLPYS